MHLEQASPAPPLRDYVRCFQQRRAHIRGAATVYPIAARPDQFLEFYLQDPYIVRIGDVAAPEIVPRSVVVGPCTQPRAQLVLFGKLDVFTIQFRPAGFHRLFRVPMEEFADQAFDARLVIGPKFREAQPVSSKIEHVAVTFGTSRRRGFGGMRRPFRGCLRPGQLRLV